MKQNGVKRSATELGENLKAVLFSPDDLSLVRGPAAGRRKLMDGAISQLRPGYGKLLSDYNKIYENKTRILRDWREKPDLLDTLGAVSGPVAKAMALGAKNALKADVAVSVTGLAGPDGDEFGHSVGTVFIGYADEASNLFREYHFTGDREAVRSQTILAALELVLEYNK